MLTTDLDMFRMDSDVKILKKLAPQTTAVDYPHWLLADSVRLATKSAHHLANKIYNEGVKNNPDSESANYTSNNECQLLADVAQEGSARKRVGTLGVLVQSGGSLEVQLQHTDRAYGERRILDTKTISQTIEPIQILNMLHMATKNQSMLMIYM